jgi:hypothetical protein
MQPETSISPWGDFEPYIIGDMEYDVPTRVTRIEGGWAVSSTVNPTCAISFMDQYSNNSPSESLRALLTQLDVQGKSIDEAIALEWARCQEFPPYRIEWNHKEGQLISELVIFLFRYKDASGNRQTKPCRFLISVGGRMTQRRINMASEAAFMTWVNYLSMRNSYEQQIAVLTDFSRGSEKWREAVTGLEHLFPKLEDHPAPKS